MSRSFSRTGGWSESVDKDAFRSGLEYKVSKQMEDAGIHFRYELDIIPYIIPSSSHKYNLDFLLPNNIIVETKGLFERPDRAKHLFIREQHPELDIRFVFSNSKQKISKASKTTYGMWCDKYSFKYADKWIPAEWFKEPKKSTSGLIPKKTKGEK